MILGDLLQVFRRVASGNAKSKAPPDGVLARELARNEPNKRLRDSQNNKLKHLCVPSPPSAPSNRRTPEVEWMKSERGVMRLDTRRENGNQTSDSEGTHPHGRPQPPSPGLLQVMSGNELQTPAVGMLQVAFSACNEASCKQNGVLSVRDDKETTGKLAIAKYLATALQQPTTNSHRYAKQVLAANQNCISDQKNFFKKKQPGTWE